jgi:predicted  nucleic acid-binding Zn-ribbon protein
VTVVPVPVTEADENPVVRRARARATRAQLVADQIGLENRLRKLPEELTKAEKDACSTGQAVTDLERRLGDRRKAHDEAVAKLEALRQERAGGSAELAAIEAELRKLDEVI